MRIGERGIRTPGTLPGTVVFKTTAIDHSAISPFIYRRGPLHPAWRSPLRVAPFRSRGSIGGDPSTPPGDLHYASLHSGRVAASAGTLAPRLATSITRRSIPVAWQSRNGEFDCSSDHYL